MRQTMERSRIAVGEKMIPQEDQVCNPELAKRLKDLKVKQESLFCYHTIDIKDNDEWRLNICDEIIIREHEYVSAFTVAELLTLLDKNVIIKLGNITPDKLAEMVIKNYEK